MEQYEKVALEIQKLQDIQFFLERTVALTKEMMEISFGEVLVKHLPAEPVVYSEEKIDWTVSMEHLYEQSTLFLKRLGVKGTAAYGGVYPKGDFMKARSEEISYLFCHLNDSSAKMKPAGHYAIIYHQGTYEKIADTYDTLLNYLEKAQLKLDSDIYEEFLLHSIAAKEEKDYITKISVKVKSREVN